MGDKASLKDLEYKRLDLLRRIHTRHTSNNVQLTSSREVKEYNHVVDQMNERQRKPPFSLVHNLPIELVLNIIMCYSTINLAISVDLLLVLTLVSTRWREVILGTPAFWTDIIIDNDINSLEILPKTALNIHLSGNMPLSLHLTVPAGCVDSIIPIVTPHKNRIRSIFFTDFLPCFHPSAWCDNLLKKFAPLPHLQEIGLPFIYQEFGPDPHKVFSEICSSAEVRHVYNVPLHQQTLENPFPNIRTLSIIDPPKLIIPLIQDYPDLEHVTFLYPRLDSAEIRKARAWKSSQTTELKWKSLRCLTPKGIEIPYIRDGALGNRLQSPAWIAYEFPIQFLYRLTRLVSLEISLDLKDLSELLRVLPSFKEMYRLGISSAFGSVERFSAPQNLVNNPNIQELSLFLALTGEDSYSSSRTDRYLFARIEQLPFALFKALGSIRVLKFYSRKVPGLPFIHGKGFTRLETLSIDWVNVIPYNMKESFFFSPSLIEFSFACPRHVLPTIAVATVPVVTIQPITEPILWRSLPEDAPLFSSMVSLRIIESDQMLWEGNSFTNLQHIFVGGSGITRFCVQLALDPSFCPQLSNLKMNQCPEWDIFFIMLERRNLALETAVRRIRRIELPLRCPNFLISHIRDLVCGKFTDRPSNYAISLLGNIDVFFDYSIQGCAKCHKALKFCTQGRSWHNSPPKIQGFLPYPEDVQSVLHRWEDRAELGAVIEESGRIIDCSLKLNETFTIDGDS